MIKFLAEKDGRPLIGIGLSRGNCQKLLDGKPIFIDLKVMMAKLDVPPNLNDGTLLIFGGETEDSMTRDLAKVMTIPPASKALSHFEEN